jgi:hypothetical protein
LVREFVKGARDVPRFFCGFVGAEEEEVVEAALVDAVEAGLVTVKKSQVGGGGEAGEGGGEAAELVGFFVLAGDAVFEEALLDGPEAAHAPVGGGHFLDHAEFDAVDGIEVLQVSGDQGVELGAGFAAHNDAVGEEAVAHGVGRGAAFTLRGFGAF